MDTDQHLINHFFKDHPDLACQFIEELGIDEIAQLMETLELEQCTIIMSRLVIYKIGKVIEIVNPARVGQLMELLSLAKAQSILRVVDETIREQILNEISNEKAAYLRRTLKYAKDQVGAYNEPFVLTLSNTINVEKALSLIKENKLTIKPHIFVLEEGGQLAGYVELNHLIVADPTAQVQSISKIIRKPVFADMNVTDLLEQWDNAFIDLPVVNAHGLFLGIVSRTSLGKFEERKVKINKSAMKAGNALSDLYLIGLTGLFGSPANTQAKT